jgi:ankyrin repeat protein
MFNSRNNIGTLKTINRKEYILVSLLSRNVTKIKELIDQYNINDIIDDLTGYTALHYAVTIPNNNDIVKYLLDNGANLKKLQKDNMDSYELATVSNKKYLFEYFKNKQDDKINDLELKNITLNNKITTLEKINKHLESTFDTYNEKIKTLKSEIIKKDDEIIKKDNENNKLKRKNVDTEEAFNQLLKKIKK